MINKLSFTHFILFAAVALLLLASPAANALDWENDIELKVDMVDEKLGKIKVAVKNGEIESLHMLTDDYDMAVKRATESIEHARRGGHDVSGVANRVNGKFRKNTQVLESLLTKVPPQARKGIQNAITNSNKHSDSMGKAKGLQKEHPGKGKAKGRGKGKNR